MKCKNSLSYPRGASFPSHYHPSQYCRRDKCLRNRITLWINYRQSGCNFLSMLPFYSWILVLISVVRRRRNVIKTREIVSAKQREEHPYPGTYICLPVLGDGDQLASPKLEQDILVGRGGYFYLELFIWSPYVSHFKENPSVCLFLAEMQVKIHNCTTPSC